MTEQKKEDSDKKEKKTKKFEQPKNILDKLFGGINLTWPKLIIFAIVIGVLVGIIMCIPAIENTPLTDIGAIMYWWVLFGVIIITNSKSNVDSALKCFIFFLISQLLHQSSPRKAHSAHCQICIGSSSHQNPYGSIFLSLRSRSLWLSPLHSACPSQVSPLLYSHSASPY